VEVVELGAGRVLSGLVKRVDRDIATLSFGAPPELDEFVKRL